MHLENSDACGSLGCARIEWGAHGIRRKLDKVELKYGVQTKKYVQQATKESILRAHTRLLGSSKAGKRRRLEAVATEQRHVEEESSAYTAGHFGYFWL